MCATVADESSKVLHSAAAAVVDGSVLGASGVELDGGEALDLFRNVVGGGVDLGDGDVVGERLEKTS